MKKAIAIWNNRASARLFQAKKAGLGTPIILLAGMLLTGCAGLGAAGVAMQSAGNSMQQAQAENYAESASTAFQQGNPSACMQLQYYQQQQLLRQQYLYQRRLQQQQQLQQQMAPSQTFCHTLPGGAVSCSTW